MKILGSTVGLADFIPPIVDRLIRKTRETIINPFDKDSWINSAFSHPCAAAESRS